MDLSIAQHQQEMGSQTLESMLVCSKTQEQEKKLARPPQEQALRCPRCDSTNTKFCYYNNYSLSQPRYFCKGCRRYWTKGGTLRNVPVGGGCRKNNKRPSSSSSSSSASSKRMIQDHHPPLITLNHHHPNPNQNPSPYDPTSDLTLAFARLHRQSNGHDHLGFDPILGLGGGSHCDVALGGNPSSSVGFLDHLRGGFLENPNGFNSNLYFGGGLGMNNNVAEDHHHHNQMGIGMGMAPPPYDPATSTAVTVTTMKQEEGDQNRVFWGNGNPWEFGGNGNMGTTHDADSGREMWSTTALAPSSWHGLLNSPLM